MEKTECKERMSSRGICVIIPVYNNVATVGRVVNEVLFYCRDVIVVDDGSTDGSSAAIASIEGITILTHAKNKGKGAALKTGFKEAVRQGFAYALTIDSDGQHYPKDIPALVRASINHPDSIVMGCRNESSRKRKSSTFANKFSNFWFTFQTLRYLPDTQSGFRLYPLKKLPLSILTSKYEAELELLVFPAWRGVRFKTVPVSVYYAPIKDQVSHFRPFQDFTRISVLNTVLCLLAVVYGWPMRFFSLLRNIGRTLYCGFMFVFFSLFVVKPFTWLYKHTHRRRHKGQPHTLHNFIYRISRFVMLKPGLPGVRFTYSVNEEVDFQKPAVYICNHQSPLDLMCMLIFTPKLIFLTNDRVWHNPFYGYLVRTAGYQRAYQGMETLLPELKSKVAHGFSIAIFPEGTRSAKGQIGRFHRGAFQIAEELKLDIVPMCLYGASRVFRKGSKYMKRGRIRIEVGKPYTREDLIKIGDTREQASTIRQDYSRKVVNISDFVDRKYNTRKS